MTCHIFFKVGQCVLTLSIDIQILSTGSPPPTHKKILFSNLLIYISFDHYLQFSISQIHSRALSYKNRTNFFFEVAPNVSPKINIIYIFYKWACEVKKYVRTLGIKERFLRWISDCGAVRYRNKIKFRIIFCLMNLNYLSWFDLNRGSKIYFINLFFVS